MKTSKRLVAGLGTRQHVVLSSLWLTGSKDRTNSWFLSFDLYKHTCMHAHIHIRTRTYTHTLHNEVVPQIRGSAVVHALMEKVFAALTGNRVTCSPEYLPTVWNEATKWGNWPSGSQGPIQLKLLAFNFTFRRCQYQCSYCTSRVPQGSSPRVRAVCH